jgi:hypothetical protein
VGFRDGNSEAVNSSLTALEALFTSSDAHATQVSQMCIPALCEILDDPHRSVESYMTAFDFLTNVVAHIPHSVIIDSKIVQRLVEWLRFASCIAQCGHAE